MEIVRIWLHCRAPKRGLREGGSLHRLIGGPSLKKHFMRGSRNLCQRDTMFKPNAGVEGDVGWVQAEVHQWNCVIRL